MDFKRKDGVKQWRSRASRLRGDPAKFRIAFEWKAKIRSGGGCKCRVMKGAKMGRARLHAKSPEGSRSIARGAKVNAEDRRQRNLHAHLCGRLDRKRRRKIREHTRYIANSSGLWGAPSLSKEINKFLFLNQPVHFRIFSPSLFLCLSFFHHVTCQRKHEWYTLH
jgi:hypothetical protein